MSIDFGLGQMLAKHPRSMVFVGRFNEQKNLPLLLDACRLVPGAQLLLVGTGPLERELGERAQRFTG